MIVICVVRLVSKITSVRFRQEVVRSVTSSTPIVRSRTVAVLYGKASKLVAKLGNTNF